VASPKTFIDSPLPKTFPHETASSGRAFESAPSHSSPEFM